MFPSPCGDVVLKWRLHDGSNFYSDVSVPLRGCGFKIIIVNLVTKKNYWFPSPCGDVVLKLRDRRAVQHTARSVSVPLRGCGFKIHLDENGNGKLGKRVSVPLRGCGFKILFDHIFETGNRGFRPLAGMWF